MGRFRSAIFIFMLLCLPVAIALPPEGRIFSPGQAFVDSLPDVSGFVYAKKTDTAADSAKFSSGRPMSVGLVLSGGGAKGIAHVGVIKALEEHNIPIDYIAGTSMGAIIGGLYSMGYTPDEMIDLILSPEFTYWSTGVFDPAKVYYFSRSEPSPAMFNFALGSKKYKANDSVPASLISPVPMNFGFMDIFSPYTAQCHRDFNRLFVPFRCVASDVYHKWHRMLQPAIRWCSNPVRSATPYVRRCRFPLSSSRQGSPGPCSMMAAFSTTSRWT